MNYNSVILVGVIVLTGAWWAIHAIRHYPGPRVMTLYIHEDGSTGVEPLAVGGLNTESPEQKTQ